MRIQYLIDRLPSLLAILLGKLPTLFEGPLEHLLWHGHLTKKKTVEMKVMREMEKSARAALGGHNPWVEKMHSSMDVGCRRKRLR